MMMEISIPLLWTHLLEGSLANSNKLAENKQLLPACFIVVDKGAKASLTVMY